MNADPPALLIDLDGTIVDYARTERRALRDVHGVLYDGQVSFERFRSAFTAANGALWADYRNGDLELDGLRTDRFARLAVTLGVRVSPIVAAATFEAALGRRVTVFADARQALGLLARDFRLVLLTDGIAKVQRAKLTRSGLTGFFEQVVISAEAGHRKPEPELFWYALDLVAAKQETTLVVGDSWASDGAGALAAGLGFCWVHRGAARPGGQAPAYLEVRDLATLARVLRPGWPLPA